MSCRNDKVTLCKLFGVARWHDTCNKHRYTLPPQIRMYGHRYVQSRGKISKVVPAWHFSDPLYHSHALLIQSGSQPCAELFSGALRCVLHLSSTGSSSSLYRQFPYSLKFSLYITCQSPLFQSPVVNFLY